MAAVIWPSTVWRCVWLTPFTAQRYLFKPVRTLLSFQHPASIGMCSIPWIYAKRPVQVSHRQTPEVQEKVWKYEIPARKHCIIRIFWHFWLLLGEFWPALYAFHTIYKQSGPNPAITAGEFWPHGRPPELEVEARTLFFFFSCGRRSSKLFRPVRMQRGYLVPSQVVALMRVMTCKRAGKHSW